MSENMMLNMSSWSEIYDIRPLLSTVKAEYAIEIGQVIYTNQFADTTILQKKLNGDFNLNKLVTMIKTNHRKKV